MKNLIGAYIFIFLLLILGSCKKDKIQNINLSSFSGQKSFEENLITKYNSNLKAGNINSTINRIIQELQIQSSISDIGIDKDSTGIFWTYENKIRCCLYLNIEDFSLDNKKSYYQDIFNNKLVNDQIIEKKGLPNNLNVLMLSPNNWQLKDLIGSYDETETIVGNLIEAGFNVKYKSNTTKSSQTISFDDYKNLNEFGVIYLKTHGALDPKLMKVCLSSGIIYTEALESEHNNEIYIEKTLMKFIDPEGNTTFGLTPEWFKISFPTPPENILFFASACSGIQNSTLSRVITGDVKLVNYGSTFFGWSSSVTLEKSQMAGIDIFNGLLEENLNCYDSWLKAVRNGSCTYVDKGKTSTMYIVGDTSLRFIAKFPSVSTADIINITASSATLGGNITWDGGTIVSERGIYYGILQNPEKTGTKLQIGSGTGSFSTSLSGLIPNKIYYVKAYAKNSQGNGYGKQVSFTTQSNNNVGINFNPNLNYGSITDIEGNVYKTIQIGTQIWMAENLKSTKFNDGSSIPLITDGLEWISISTSGYCWYDNNDVKYKNIYGALYNWSSVNTGKLCPSGWHVPRDYEWTQLEMLLGINNNDAYMIDWRGRETNTGGKLKETGILHWVSPNTGATNLSGFTALPGGSRYDGSAGFFTDEGKAGIYWTSTEYPSRPTASYIRIMEFDSCSIFRGVYHKTAGFSVRCIKDN